MVGVRARKPGTARSNSLHKINRITKTTTTKPTTALKSDGMLKSIQASPAPKKMAERMLLVSVQVAASNRIGHTPSAHNRPVKMGQFDDRWQLRTLRCASQTDGSSCYAENGSVRSGQSPTRDNLGSSPGNECHMAGRFIGVVGPLRVGRTASRRCSRANWRGPLWSNM